MASQGDIVLSWNYGENNSSLNGYFSLYVTIETKRVINLRNTYLYFTGDSHFTPCKEYTNGKTRVKMTLTRWAGATIDNLPSCIQIELHEANGTVLERIRPSFNMARFTGELFENGSVADRNILLFGLAGSSKSSFINSVYTMLSSELQMEMAQSGGSGERVTTVLKSYRMVDVDRKIPTRYRLWDTWGLERGNYKSAEFQSMIRGRLTSGWEMDTKVRLGDLDTPPKDAANIQHCVIFFIPAAELDNQESELLKKTVEFMQIATECGVSSVLAITKVDATIPEYRESPSAPNKQVENLVNRAALIFHLQPYRIIPLINYLHETEKSFEIDRVVHKLFRTATKVADAGVLKSQPKSPEDKALDDLINS